MKPFLLNLVLAIVWCLLTGSAHPWNFVAGVLVGAAVVSSYGMVSSGRHYVVTIWRITRFGLYFFRILVLANIQIAREVVTPGLTFRPRFIRYDVSALNRVEKVTLSNAITLTPGTLVVDVSPCGDYFYIHCMYGQNRDAAVAELDELTERMREGVFS
jgi:multicomponent Na+:H+ antiporter subunit E